MVPPTPKRSFVAMRQIQYGHPLRRQLRQQTRPAGGAPLIGLMLAIAVAYLGSTGHLIGAGAPDFFAVDPAALPIAIDSHGELPVPPAE
jgi:hypothetical protein